MSDIKNFKSEDFTDKDLVDASTETIGGNPSPKSLWAQSELRRRLMKSIRNLDKSTSRYSKVIVILTVALFVLGCMQFVATITPPLTDWKQILIIIVLVFSSILYFVKKTIKSIEKW